LSVVHFLGAHFLGVDHLSAAGTVETNPGKHIDAFEIKMPDWVDLPNGPFLTGCIGAGRTGSRAAWPGTNDRG
jgi:hypothetical protein